MSEVVHFETRAPSTQTAVDVFRDRWASDLYPLLGVEGTGVNLLFTQDRRPQLAIEALGRFDYTGMSILEIGPLEGAHTYIFEKMNAEKIVCVEASAEAWLKCLVVKELLELKRSKFLLGEIGGFLKENEQCFDLVFCSGVLYHLSDPAAIIASIAAITNRCFVWTHVYDEKRRAFSFCNSETVERSGISVEYWSHTYGDKGSGYWGGVDVTAAWMSKEDLLRTFRAAGLSDIHVIEDQFDHPNGPAVLFLASRPD